jgi:hypothetical protein
MAGPKDLAIGSSLRVTDGVRLESKDWHPLNRDSALQSVTFREFELGGGVQSDTRDCQS